MVVCDGVTVGRFGCGAPRCANPPTSARDIFCPEHAYLQGICHVTGCDEKVVLGSKTCADPCHREAEEKYYAAGTAAFQLKLRYERSRHDEETEGVVWEEGEELDTGSDAVYEVLISEKDSAHKDGTSKAVRGQFGRRRTHNEQLIIAPCGMILARETFTFSEAFSLVAVCVCLASTSV